MTTLSTPEGTFEVVGNQVVFTPAPNYTGTTPAVPYRVTMTDDQVAESTVTVTVTPTATPDTATTPVNTPVTVDVLANDGLDPANVAKVELLDGSGSPVTSLTTPEGVFEVVNNEVVFTPAQDYTGTTPAVPYRVTMSDDQVVESTVTVTVAPAATPDTATTPVNTPVTVDVLANDGLDPANVKTLELLDGSGAPVTSLTIPEGTFEVVGNQVVFTPAADYTGTTPAVPYRVTMTDDQVVELSLIHI